MRIHAAGVSISDCVIRGGNVRPLMWLPFRLFVGFWRPRDRILGLELSGTVEAVGAKVSRFRPGDEIFACAGRHFGAYAEYVCLREGGKTFPSQCVIALKPQIMSHSEAATVPTRGTMALHFLKTAHVRRGERVLIYGASGGIGTFAVQIAKHLGAEVTAVCGKANTHLVQSLGADRVMHYDAEGTADSVSAYDVFFDAAGRTKSSSLKSRCISALTSGGRIISVDRPAKISASTLDELIQLIQTGVVRPVLDKVYTLAQVADAQRYVELGHKRGGVAVIMNGIAPTA
ncbi:MAG: NAD(P)-dependent alcohol dehydrogenase [Candidatus Eremiobacteraeota bacterium]|nr:NAD(P)-dependent alcohol dehydrogenase [Candidatus Eremiobacteraeota bacterium]